jgi:K+-sensing histidine kinase KdpD
MANQDPPSPTPTAVTLHYGLAVLSIKESHSGRLWATGNTPRGAIFYLRLPTKGEADE